MVVGETAPLLRARTSADLPDLVEVLAEQQPATRYPLRWPLPFPVEQFLVRETEEQAWVAEQGGRVVGHVAVGAVGSLELAAQFQEALGTDELANVSVLFVAQRLRGSGLGGRLLDTAVAWARARGRLPVLDVVQGHAPAVAVYRHRGWQEVGQARPAWLPADQPPVLLMALSPAERAG